MMDWFEVDKKGLAQVVGRRGYAWFLYELWQNAIDEDVNRVIINFQPTDKRGFYRFQVEDDSPEGFKDLRHAWTLYADSYKKGDPTKRGRFNLGEKLVLAICEEANITTTKGKVVFDKNGRRSLNVCTERGSLFTGVVKLRKQDFEEALQAMGRVIPPRQVITWFNGVQLAERLPVLTFEVTLPTEIANGDGQLSRTRRRTKVELYDPKPGEVASIYEMGIPVVETRDRWHLNILQKVPLNTERDNVTPAYLRELRTDVTNHAVSLLTEEDTTKGWVTEALAEVEPAVAKAIFEKRFPKAVAFDPSDLEANKIAAAQGYQVIGGRTFTSAVWENLKQAEAVKPAGQVTPSDKLGFSYTGDGIQAMPYENYTPAMKLIADHAKNLAQHLLGHSIQVTAYNHPQTPTNFAAAYGRDTLTFNVKALGYRWFEHGVAGGGFSTNVHQLILHEFTHDRVHDHLSSEIHDEACRLGAKLTDLALHYPELFRYE